MSSAALSRCELDAILVALEAAYEASSYLSDEGRLDYGPFDGLRDGRAA
jgi:hypothetical protein